MALTKIRYMGTSDERIMTDEELTGAGVPVGKDLYWGRANGWTDMVEDPSDEFMLMLKRDGNFIVVPVDEAGNEQAAPVLVNDPSKADDTGQTVIDKNQAKAVEEKQDKAAAKS